MATSKIHSGGSMEQNKETEKLLQEVGKNIAMATQSLDVIIPMVDDDKFKEYLSELNGRYNVMLDEAKMLASAIDVDLKLTSPLEQAELWTAIKMKTVFDKSTRKFAQMIFLGTNMGIPNLIVAICDNKNASNESIVLAKKLKELEETSDETLKMYLCK